MQNVDEIDAGERWRIRLVRLGLTVGTRQAMSLPRQVNNA